MRSASPGPGMSALSTPGWVLLAFHAMLQVAFIGRALLRPHREPASRIAWVMVILVAPVVGMLAYVLFGETNIGRRRIARLRRRWRSCRPPRSRRRRRARRGRTMPPRFAPLFRVGQSISGFLVVGGNRAELLGRLRRDDRPPRRRHRRRRVDVHLLLHLARRTATA